MAAKMKLRGAEYIVKILECLEVCDMFAYPGGAVLPIYDALAFSKLNPILVRHEQGAAFAANAYARLAGRPGFCLATSGPGATNLVTGIADAYADSVPMVAITGQTAANLIGTDAFQETDITGICIPITKKTYIIKKIEDAPTIFMDAYSVAMQGRPGPVLIDIPKDVQNSFVSLEEGWEADIKCCQRERTNKTKDSEMDRAAALLQKAKKPLVIGGHGLLLSESWENFRAFVKREHLPVITTILGLGALRHDDPLSFQWLGMHGMKYANDAVQEADVILALGIRFDDRITGRLDTFAPNAKIIHVDIDPSEAGKNVPTEVFLCSDLRLFLERFPKTIDRTNQPDRKAWVDKLTGERRKYPLKQADESVFNQVAALHVLNQMMQDDAIITTDVGQHQMWAAQYLQRLEPNHFVTSGGLGSMGFGLPAAMGAQAARPDHEVWCVSGDGSFQMNIQELITCVQEKWPIKILLLDNAYLGMVRQWQEQFYEKNYSGVELLNPDFTKLAEAYGIDSARVQSVEELRTAIGRAQAVDKPFLIHARVLKEDNVLPMVAPGTSLSDTIYYPTSKKKAAELERVKK